MPWYVTRETGTKKCSSMQDNNPRPTPRPGFTICSGPYQQQSHAEDWILQHCRTDGTCTAEQCDYGRMP